LEKLLAQLLDRLEIIAENHGELLDSEVREAIGVAVMDGFVRGHGTGNMPAVFGMLSAEANQEVRYALIKYINDANLTASLQGITSFRDRLRAFQNINVANSEGNTYDDFFGHTPDEFYDDYGNVVRTF
jgi:hypothetical protein